MFSLGMIITESKTYASHVTNSNSFMVRFMKHGGVMVKKEKN